MISEEWRYLLRIVLSMGKDASDCKNHPLASLVCRTSAMIALRIPGD